MSFCPTLNHDNLKFYQSHVLKKIGLNNHHLFSAVNEFGASWSEKTHITDLQKRTNSIFCGKSRGKCYIFIVFDKLKIN